MTDRDVLMTLLASGRERLLTPGEVAVIFRVDPKTVTRWCTDGKVPSVRTPGGHRRIPASAIRAILDEAA